MKKSLVWFRNDLRMHDNEALTQAMNGADEVLLVYIFDDYYEGKSEFGFHKQGDFRKKFVLESVFDLKQNLQKAGCDLLVLKGDSVSIIADLCQQHQITQVYASSEVAFDEVQIQNKLKHELKAKNIFLHLFDGGFLFHPNDLPYKDISDLPDIFSQYRKKVEYLCKVRPIFEIDDFKPSVKHGLTDDWPEWTKTINEIKLDKRAVLNFKGGETEALHHSNEYIWKKQLIKTYKITRNGLIGSDYSSKYSAWLALGCISPRQIYWEVKRFEEEVEANDSTYWLVFELLWRDYFRLVAKKFNARIFQFEGIGTQKKLLRNDEEKLYLWINGETGNDFVDANMNELRLTGFMSNRGRQNVASYLVNDLKVNWQMGAEYFEQQLIDYDPCSNWGNWCYLAGVGNDPRENRYFNTQKQAEMYDADGAYRKLWLT